MKSYHHFVKLFDEKRLVNSVKFVPSRIKLINPMQKYSHITESNAFILKIFVTIVDLSIKFSISFGMCSFQNGQNK